MGLFGFFSRKSAPVNEKSNVLKAQPYNATVALQPPFQGSAPVPGNGPNILKSLQKTHPRLKNGQVISFGPHSHASSSRLRDEKNERPRTAPSQDKQAWGARQGSGSSNAHEIPSLPPVPPPKQRPPYRLPDKKPDLAAHQSKQRPPYRLSDKVHDPMVLDKPTPAFARERSWSIHSNRSGHGVGHVDLLDAQADLHPTDFRQRVRAAGARDYGEDVADRNIGENGTKFNSDDRPIYNFPVAREDPKEDTTVRTKKRYSLGSSLRTQSLTSSTSGTRLKPKQSPEAQGPPPKSRLHIHEDEAVRAPASSKAEWRKSMPSYLSSARTKREQDEKPEFPAELRIKTRAVTGSTEGESRLRVNDSPEHKPLPHLQGEDDTPGARNDVNGEENSAEGVTALTPGSVSKAIKAARRRTMSHAPNLEVGQVPSKRLSLQNLYGHTTGPAGMEEESAQAKPQIASSDARGARRSRGSTVGSQDFPSTAELQMRAFKSPQKSSHKRPSGRDRLTGEEFGHIQRPASSSSRLLARIDSNEVPERTSSARHWSMDSTSATSLSSNPFRPQSRHTANTSIDLSPFAKDANFSHDSLGAMSYRTAPVHSLPSAHADMFTSSVQKPYHKRKQSITFNIDDYVSSDDEFESPRHPRGEFEEHLLFKDTGFALSGFGLPGLNGAIDNDTPRFTPASPPRPVSRPGKARRVHDYDGPAVERYRPGRFEPPHSSRRRDARQQMLAYSYGDSDSSDYEADHVQDDDSDDDMSFDIPMTRRSTPAQAYRTARYANHEEIIEEEREVEKVDLNATMKLRKEEKRRKRLSGASGTTIRPRSHSGKGKEVFRPQKYDVAGFDADVE